MTVDSWHRDPSSFRDPSGFIFRHEGVVYRQLAREFVPTYRRLTDGGLYSALIAARLLIPHDEVRLPFGPEVEGGVTLCPAPVPFISYPYEWCFEQMKAAALLTLEVQRRALHQGMILRDASPYNVQFIGTRPLLIDTLSLGEWQPGTPWGAYRQFCEEFLAPLVLMSYAGPAYGRLTRVWTSGVPLEMCRRLLPARSWLRPGLALHLHLHGRVQGADHARAEAGRLHKGGMTQVALLALTDSLIRTVEGLRRRREDSLWSGYARTCNYSEDSQARKRGLVHGLLLAVANSRSLKVVWDCGANTGEFSRIAAEVADYVVSLDMDEEVVRANFRAALDRDEDRILPLVQDLRNPSTGLGWHHSERRSLLERGPADVVLALAVVHHLAIGANVPLPMVARFFRDAGHYLVVEFVPKEDAQVQSMLRVRPDMFPDYSRQGFESAFEPYFDVVRVVPIEGTVRTLFLMRRRADHQS